MNKKLIEILIPVLLIVMLYVTYFLYNKLKLITTKKENYEVLIPMTNSFSFKVVHDDDDDEILILQCFIYLDDLCTEEVVLIIDVFIS
jgi:hypothetical protein